MELHHQLRIKVDNRDGLIALGMILAAVLIAVLGTVALTRSGGQEGGREVALSVRAGHGLYQAQDGGVRPSAGGLDDRR